MQFHDFHKRMPNIQAAYTSACKSMRSKKERTDLLIILTILVVMIIAEFWLTGLEEHAVWVHYVAL